MNRITDRQLLTALATVPAPSVGSPRHLELLAEAERRKLVVPA